MNICLAVLNPRHIRECVESIMAVPVDQVWLSRMTEGKATQAFNAHVRATAYSHYAVVSDDVVVSLGAWERLLDDCIFLEHLEVIRQPFALTGWCTLDQGPNKDTANVCSNELKDPWPLPESYDFWPAALVRNKDMPFPASFAGMCLTMAPRELWLEHELRPYVNTHTLREFACDYNWSRLLQEADVPLFVSPGAECRHVKEVWNMVDQDASKKLLIGKEPPAVDIRRYLP